MSFKRVVLTFIMGLFCALFISCPTSFFPSENPKNLESIKEENILRGEQLSESYPSWMVKGYTSWFSWQSEQGIMLHDYVSDSVISDDYNGCFRLLINGQDLGICFNDVNNTVIELMYLFSDSVKTVTDNKFEADCYVKKNLKERNTETNSAKLIINKTEDGHITRFIVKKGETEIIDVDVHDYGDKLSIERPSWLKKNITTSDWMKDFWSMSHFYDNYNPACSILEFSDDPWFGLDNPKPFLFFHFSYEGVSIKGQDDVNHIFSLNLSDGESGGFADYVEIRLRDDKVEKYDAVDLTFYKITDGAPSVVKKYEKLICFD